MPFSSVASRMYDQWVTREPDYPEAPPQPHCAECGAFLAFEPDSREDFVETESCDGQSTVVTDTYTRRDKEVLDIIGWDHLGETYSITYDPICGQSEPHQAHQYPVGGGTVEIRVCHRCGAENKEASL